MTIKKVLQKLQQLEGYGIELHNDCQSLRMNEKEGYKEMLIKKYNLK